MSDTPSPKHLTREEVTARFKARVAELGGADKASEKYGVSSALVYMIQNGQRRPNEIMLRDIGIRHVAVPASEHWEEVPEGEK